MAVESGATYISDLNIAWPDGAVDPKSDGDNHLRLIKRTIKSTFPNVTGAMNATHGNLNSLVGISGSVTSTQLNFLIGLTTNVQAALDARASLAGAIFTGATGVRSASGDSPLLFAYNQTFGGAGLFAGSASGNMNLVQLSTTGGYQKRIITHTRDGGVVLYNNDTPVVQVSVLGAAITGSMSTTLAASVGTSLSVGTNISALGGMTSLGNIASALGSVSDTRGQLQSYRSGTTLNLASAGAVFSSIPSDATMIKIVFADASFSAGSQDMGLAVDTATGYNGTTQGTSSGGSTFRWLWSTYNQVVLTSGAGASDKIGGAITLTKINGTTWLVESLVGPWATTNGPVTAPVGSVTVSAAPSTITIGSLSGVGVYDSGFATMYVYR